MIAVSSGPRALTPRLVNGGPQGAGQAIEDAAALALLLPGPAGGREDGVAAALLRFEALRKPHAAAVVSAAQALQRTNHLPDGAEQRQRDAALAATAEPQSCPIFRAAWHDAEAECRLGGEAGV